MKYEESLEYISFINSKKGISLGLENIKELCNRLGNPQNDLKFVHIAGTNGKGSTLAFISTILKESGYKVGRYVSPTIRDYRERIQINERMISMKDTGLYMERVKEACDSMQEEGINYPTSFEIETALAFLYFKDKGCDVVVLETGMGGIDDATNIINTTVLAVLVSISMDHMQYLGNTLMEITQKKCGIIKDRIPVVSIEQNKESMEIIEASAKKHASNLIIVHKSDIGKVVYRSLKQTFEYKNNKYEIGLGGVWQNENAALAIESVLILKEQCSFDKISDNSISRGLLKTVWPARFQIVSKKPLLIVDGAHNSDAAKRLKQSIELYYKDKTKIYIIGMFRDKETEEVVSTIVTDGAMVFTCAAPNNPRALSSVEMADIVRAYNKNVTSCDSVEEAVEFASAVADGNSVIIACGSLAYLGKVIDIFDVK